ncbi:WD40/YVTN/BNR-like repeat-containing protein, partial [candidate division KSB1 bacterium]
FQQKMFNRSSFYTLIVCFILFFSLPVFAQTVEENLIKDLRWRNIGPANMSGRVVSIDAVEGNFETVYVASASGGVWKSTNAGTTFEPIFDDQPAASIGDVEIFQKNPDIVWVGTGESNVRNSAAWGDGIYKSTDGGETFTNMGLKDTHHIDEIVTHPENPDIVYVAAQGHLWGYTGQRGIFKTTDGGRTWRKLTNGLPDDGKTSAGDLVMDPSNPNILYSAFWERIRTAYSFDSGGENGGIFKSTDAGASWKKLENGLPGGITGNIGLAISRSNPNVLMTIFEHGFQPAQNDPDYNDMTKLGSGVYRSEDGGSSWQYMNRFNNRPFYYSHIWINPQDDELVYILAGSFQFSEDGGRTLRRPSGGGVHGDYHALWLDPNNKERYYIGSDGGSYLTHDHGNNFIKFDNYVLAQYYIVGVDMREPYYVYGGLQDNGSWGGPSNSRDSRGIFTDSWFSIGGGDGFHNKVDPTDWRVLYNESQNGYISRHNVETRERVNIRPRANTILNYREYISEQTEAFMRENEYDDAFRYNWSSPIVISPHNPHTIYFGGNHLFRSVDRGDTWKIISPDLSTNDPVKTNNFIGGLSKESGHAEIHCALITISESPLTPGLIWTGTDDGNIHITRNGGVSWENMRPNVRGVPEATWVSRLEASHFDEGTAYLTFDGHRSDNFTTWVFKTTDYGRTWINITNNLPDNQPVYVIIEDLKNPNLLFVGTEFAVFYSVTGGTSWTKLNNNMPTVAYHDLVIHPRDGDLVAGTHGRGVWIMDDITPLQQLTDEVLASDGFLFQNRVHTSWRSINTGGSGGAMYFRGENPPTTAAINYYLGTSARGTVQFEISNVAQNLKRTFSIDANPGINRLMWDLRFDAPGRAGQQQQTSGRGGRGRGGPAAGPGDYLIKMTYNGQIYTSTITVRDDPNVSGNR